MKLSFPSLHQIIKAIFRVITRFPLVVLVSLIGTVSAIWLVDVSFASQEEYPRLLTICFVSGLGISFLFAVATFLEQKTWSIASKGIIKALGLVLLIGYYFLLKQNFINGPYEIYYRLFLFALSSHLLVSFSPFVGSNNLDQFWEYNKTLFLRILLSVLYSGVLFIGLSIALLAIDNLLGLDIDGETYFQLFLFLGGIFNTWFFLAGVPEDEVSQKQNLKFPTGLRIFVQYVLIPLVSVYIFILYLYVGKILIEWELPNGWVSNLVLSFSIAGILSLLLLYPIRNSNEYKWVSFYSKFYYLALIPLIGLLMLSIWVRISEYGVTINRYFVATLGVWLTGIVIYFILSKTKSIKVIPTSLCLISLAISIGPLGAFAVSERSQLGKFETILSQNNMLQESGMIQKATDEISFEDRKELSSVVDYIVDNHSVKTFSSYVENFSDSIDRATDVFDLMDIDYVARWVNENNEIVSFYFSAENTWAGDVSGFDEYLNNIILNPSADSEIVIKSGEAEWKISIDEGSNIFKIEERISNKNINIEINPIINQMLEKTYNLENNYSIPMSKLQFDFENEEIMVRLYVNRISGSNRNEITLTNITSDILIKIK
tara:strand:- start:8931 stop:10739 length:1809 start_codon:yes stop_codon:yes gene_type:complete